MKKYVINLDRRPDKWQYVIAELKRVGIFNYERFKAIEAPEPRDGCRMSHLSVLNLAPKKGVFLVMEDDVEFLPNWRNIMLKAVSQLPRNWDLLYGGSTLTKDLERHSENLYRLKGGWCTHFLLFNNQNGIADFILNNNSNMGLKVDVFYADVVQEQFNCFITYPMTITQHAGISNIVNRFTDYSIIKQRYDLHTKNT